MQRRSIDRRSLTAPGGFTLIEMLVATTLVVMMMLLFAQIYTAAVRSLNDQQALARNDQRMRSVDLVLRSDLLKGSFRQVPGSRGIVPLVYGDTVHTPQKGYFYLSVNDRSNPVDNVLQFTMLVSPDNRVHDQTPFYGRCQGWQYPNTLNNHPDEDDGIPGNFVGMSRGAEVSYFVRGGNLYRRQLLLRDPALGTVGHGDQPVNASGAAFIADETAQTDTGTQVDINGSYYQRYDYAAYASSGTGAGLRFLGLTALENYGATGTGSVSLGLSPYRFGFNPTNGQPVEFAGTTYFGRMTHAETGSRYWVWPAAVNYYRDQSNNPVNVASPNPLTSGALTYNASTNLLTAGGNLLYNTTRVNEDLLLNNVEAFDIEVWDPTTDLFVQLGAATGTTGFNADARLNQGYGPNATIVNNWVFDTGHPGLWNDNPALSATIGKPAYRPKLYLFSEDSDNDNALDAGEDIDGDGSLDNPVNSYPYRLSGTTYTPGEIVFKPGDTTQSIAYRCVRSGEDRNGNGASVGTPETEDTDNDGVLDPGEDKNNNGVLDVEDYYFPANYPTAMNQYQGNGTLNYGTTGATQPAWPSIPGIQFDDGSVTWESFDNRIGLEMIRITVRTRDTTTGNPRQFSIIHSFVEPPPGE